MNLDAWRKLAHDMPALPLLFNAALSERRAAQLINGLGIPQQARILDLGCGWGELLLRALSGVPDAIGVGVDRDTAAIARARAAARDRDLTGRAIFVCTDLLTYGGPPVDVVLAVGIGHTTPSPRDTLALVNERLVPGGSALYADGYWKRRPTPVDRAASGHVRELGSLHDLTADAVVAGFDVLVVSDADDDELQSFSWATRNGLLQRSSERDSDYERAVIGDQERLCRDVLLSLEGFAYLVLRKPG